MQDLSTWYKVSFDDQAIYRAVAPPGGEAWNDDFAWNDIIRVCYLTADLFGSDELYFFTSQREESYVIPTEADGVSALLDALMQRGLFPAELIIEAAGTNGKLFCWPPADQ